MQNKKLIALIILSILAVFSLIYGLTSSPRTRYRASAGGVDIKDESSQEMMKIIAPSKRNSKRTSYITWGRNPFAPKEVRVKKTTKLILSGVMWDDTDPKAIINNTIIGIGGKIGKNKVVEIKKDSVVLNNGTRTFELRLHLRDF